MLTRRLFIRLVGSAFPAIAAHTLLRTALLQDAATVCPVDGGHPLRGWHSVNKDVDLEALVRRYIALVPVPHPGFAPEKVYGLCPFCNNSWESLVVYRDENLYVCEACEAGYTSGDVLDFFTRIEAIRYPEAVVRLRRMLGEDASVARRV